MQTAASVQSAWHNTHRIKHHQDFQRHNSDISFQFLFGEIVGIEFADLAAVGTVAGARTLGRIGTKTSAQLSPEDFS